MTASPDPNPRREYIVSYDACTAYGTVHLISCRHITRAKNIVAWPQVRGMTREGIRMLISFPSSGGGEFLPSVSGLNLRLPPLDSWDIDWDYYEGDNCIVYPIRICKHCLPDPYSVKTHLH